MKMIFRKKKTRGLWAFAVFLTMLFITAAPMIIYAAYNNNPMKITVRQFFSTSSASVDNKFTYVLEPLEPGSPMPAEGAADGYVFSINGNNDRQTSPIKFNYPGLYKYKLSQLITTEKPGYTYDRQVYTIHVHVDAELNVIVIVWKENGEKAANVDFYNSYNNPVPPTTVPPVTTTEQQTTTAPQTTTAQPTTTATEPSTVVTEQPTMPATEPPATVPPTIDEPTAAPEYITEPDIEIIIDEPRDMAPRPTELSPDESPEFMKPPYQPGGTDPYMPPNPTNPGNLLLPDGDGYLEIDDEGNPLGRWFWDDDAGEWIFEEFPTQNEELLPPVITSSPGFIPKDPPRTGDESNAALYIALLIIGGIFATGATAYLFIGGKNNKRLKEENEIK